MVARRPLCLVSGGQQELPTSDMLGRVAFQTDETSVASAATTSLGTATTRAVVITGTTAITSFGIVPYGEYLIRFAGSLTLTHNATSLILPTGANIVTAVGDTAIARSDASGNWRVLDYTRASGKPLTGPAVADITDSSASGRTVLTGTADQGATALGLGTGSAVNFASITTSGTGSFGGNIGIASTLPFIQVRNTSAPTDAKLWETYVDTSGTLIGRTTNDAYSGASNWMQVSRSGATATGVSFLTPVSSTGPLKPATYTVATLPTAGAAGRIAVASNGRAYNGAGTLQAAGAGTGVLVTDDGTAWRVAGTNQTVQA